jgi:imidazolonepropionase-like amidohydrolase
MNRHLRATLLPEDVERDLFVTGDGRITFDDGSSEARTVLDGGFVLPGLADVHAHLAMSSPAGDDAPDRDRAVASARAQLENGVLAIREPGAPNHESAKLGVDDDLPRVISAGRWLAPPGRFLEGFAREVGPRELAEAAVEESRIQGWAKIIGDWRGDQGFTPNFGPEDVEAACRSVHAAGGRLALHALTREVLEMGIEAGVDSIEHGLGLEREHAEAMAERGIVLVPTMSAVASPPPPGADDEIKARSAARARRHPEQVRMAWEAGILVLAGTDAAIPHGLIREEVRRLLEAGLSASAALGAASWEARRFLGLPGIEEGAPADLVAFDRDPRDDLAVLAQPTLIALDGRVIGRRPSAI